MTDYDADMPRQRGLKVSLYKGRLPSDQLSTHASTAAFKFALLAIVAEFCISSNTLTALGIVDGQPGGNPFVKFVPGTYLALLGAMVAIVGGPSPGRRVSYLFSKAPTLILFFASIFACMVFAAVNVGVTGIGVYVDTYLSAGAIAVIMVNASDRQRMILARLVLALCLINVVMSLMEYVHQDHFIPLQVNDELVKDEASSEFRPAALYGHPLTGAMATSFGVFLVLSLRLNFITTATCFGVLAIGLLGFGGRAALVVTLAVLALWTILTLARDFIRGQLNGRLLGAILLSVSILGPVSAFLLTATPVGERIAARAYYDESAEVRADQWLVLDKVTPHQALFGTPNADLEQIYYQVGLSGVENPLIMIFLNLGILGSPIFACGLIAFFVYLRHAYPASGWLLLAAIAILSSSNSIGVKGPDLFMMTACAVTMSGRTEQVSSRVRRVLRRSMIPAHLRLRGLTTEVHASFSALGRPKAR
jgi:hypothetical protein